MYNHKHHQFQSLYNHKFGFHINGPSSNAFDEVFRLKPKVVKTLDFSVAVMKKIKQEIPDIFLIGRLYVQPQDFGQLSGGTSQAARQKGIEMAEKILREEVNKDRHHINGQPIFDAWESLNEVFPEWTDEDTQKLYDEYQVAFGEKMRAAGFEPVAFNFGQGNGRGQQWLKLYPGTLEFYNYLGFHEYDWPTMDRLHTIGLNGPSEPHNLLPGVGQGRGNDGMWRCLRYRRIMNEGIRQKYGDQHTVIITECGMTQGVWEGPSKDLGPWAKALTVPAKIPGGIVPTPIPVEDYWQSLQWYNSELMKDDYVMGACLFATGATGRPEWETFEHLGHITDRLFAFQKVVDEEERPAPSPVPPPPTLIPSPLPSAPPPILTPKQPSLQPAWTYTLETGPGLGLLVGDIGLANEPITITIPDGSQHQRISGSKPEFGVGGFEIYAQTPGNYIIEFLGQRFGFALDGKFTKVIFQKTVQRVPLPPVRPIIPPEPTSPLEPEWRYTLETGQGLGLLVGDIGLPNEPITITKPNGAREQVMSGSKLEFGPGGFETYAQAPGLYTIEFLDQRFELSLDGRFTKVIFERQAAALEGTVAASITTTPSVSPVGPLQKLLNFFAKLFGKGG